MIFAEKWMSTNFSTILKQAVRFSAAKIFITWLVFVTCLMFFIPQFKEIYSGMRVEIPKFTTAILQLSFFMNDWWLLILPMAFGLPIIIFNVLVTESGLEVLAPYLVRIPILSSMYEEYLLVSFFRTWLAMPKDGCNPVETIKIARSKTAAQADFSIIQAFLESNVVIQDSMSHPDTSKLRTILETYETKAAIKANKIRDFLAAIAIVSLGLATETAVLSVFMPMLAIIMVP